MNRNNIPRASIQQYVIPIDRIWRAFDSICQITRRSPQEYLSAVNMTAWEEEKETLTRVRAKFFFASKQSDARELNRAVAAKSRPPARLALHIFHVFPWRRTRKFARTIRPPGYPLPHTRMLLVRILNSPLPSSLSLPPLGLSPHLIAMRRAVYPG